MPNDAAVFLIDTWQETGYVNHCQKRNIEGIAGSHEAGSLLRTFNVQNTSEEQGLVANDADRVSINAHKTTDDALRPMWEVFKKFTIIDDRCNDFFHVVRLVGRHGKNVAQFRTQTIGIIASINRRWLFHIILWHKRHQKSDVIKT